MTIFKQFPDAQMEVHERTKKLSGERKITYTEALPEVLRDDPQLAEAYTDGLGIKNKKTDYTGVKDAGAELWKQAEDISQHLKIPADEAFKIVIRMKKNEALAKVYTGVQ